MDESVETNAQLSQHCVHIFPIHGLPHVLHLPTDVGTYLGAGLTGGETHRETWKTCWQNNWPKPKAIQKQDRQVEGIWKLLICFLFVFFACELSGGGWGPACLTVVYWIMTLFSSSGLKSVFFCSVAKMCFICPTMQFIVLCVAEKYIGKCLKDHSLFYYGFLFAHVKHITCKSTSKQTDLSIPVSSFTSICSITSFFLCRHSANFGDELETQMLKVKSENYVLVRGSSNIIKECQGIYTLWL